MSGRCCDPISTGCSARHRALGLPALHVMGSSGGVFDIAEALRMPAMAVESGPAAGVIAASLAGRQLGPAEPDLVRHGRHHREGQRHRRRRGLGHRGIRGRRRGQANRWMHGTGHPIRVPVIDLAEVSAGGGSIAWVDPGGALKVGPHSAGAEPGPAAYGAGGTQPDSDRRRRGAGLSGSRGIAGRRAAHRPARRRNARSTPRLHDRSG